MIKSPAALWEMIEKAKIIHQQERQLSIQSIQYIGELEASKVSVQLGLTIEEFCELVGISPASYWKRLRVYRLFFHFPEFRDMFESGETELSQLAIIAAKVTGANADIVRKEIKGKSKRDVEIFAARIQPDGSLSKLEAVSKFSASLDAELDNLIDRVRCVVAHSGKYPGNVELLEEMAKAFLKQKDPMEKATRAEARKAKKEEKALTPEKASSSPATAQVSSLTPVNAEFPSPTLTAVPSGKPVRSPIPSSIRHTVYIRDQGQCTFTGVSGKRCQERHMLEYDHIIMVCRGGKNTAQNVRMRCRYHNASAAAVELVYIKPRG